jgi:hypothetical protein
MTPTVGAVFVLIPTCHIPLSGGGRVCMYVCPPKPLTGFT